MATTSPRKTAGPRTTRPAPHAQAKAAGLAYVNDESPGIRRVGAAPKFRYEDPSGRPVRDRETLDRIKALAIPPAWTGVWVCPRAEGHLQATGRDDRGRKQYRYHALWRSERDATKYARMVPFARALPKIRERVERDLARPGLSREKVLALVVRLLEASMIRVGNDEYARSNNSYGLTTMRDRHAKVVGGSVRFQFKGKSGVKHAIDIRDARLARLVKKCQDLPGQELFQYLDDAGNARDIGSDDVNGYLREITGHDFTAKDFRTWAGTVLAALALREFLEFDSDTQARKNIVRAIETVSARLGNTPSVCRKCYVHPHILDAYLDGTMLETLKQRADQEMADLHDLKPEEAAVLALIQRSLVAKSKPASSHRAG